MHKKCTQKILGILKIHIENLKLYPYYKNPTLCEKLALINLNQIWSDQTTVEPELGCNAYFQDPNSLMLVTETQFKLIYLLQKFKLNWSISNTHPSSAFWLSIKAAARPPIKFGIWNYDHQSRRNVASEDFEVSSFRLAGQFGEIATN